MNPIRLLTPRETVATVFDIDFARLRASGKKAVLFDLDNTLRRRWSASLFPEVSALLKRLAEMGFRVGILTNRKHVEQDPLIRELALQMELTYRARKPSRRGYLELLSKLRVPCHEAVMVGDRRLTDVLGANWLGLYTILVTQTRPGPARRTRKLSWGSCLLYTPGAKHRQPPAGGMSGDRAV